ncbi:MAG: HNH endonuclease [Candidatus Cloacimonetes bacterium]|nr:HNH endonuclease [Candidatus Cloacimonadota bacterium]
MIDITGYEGKYAVTKDGRVWSYPKPCSSINGIFLKPTLTVCKNNRNKPHNHHSVMLYKNNEAKRFQIHRLVAQAFILNPENKPDINHIDGNPLNNNVNNLEWVTKSENIRHAISSGLIDNFTEKCKRIRSENGKKMGAINSKKFRRLFSMETANQIRNIYAKNKISFRQLAKEYNCSDKTIGNIIRNLSYVI